MISIEEITPPYIGNAVLEFKMKIKRTDIASPIIWTGDLSDDFTARWAGLMLRAEEMDDRIWWWAVYDMEKDEMTIDSSNEYDIIFTSAREARMAAEQAAKMYLDVN